MDRLSLNQKKVLSLFEKSPELTVGDVVVELSLGRPTAKQVLRRLCELGFIRQHGYRKGAYYTRLRDDIVADQFGNELAAIYQGRSGFGRLFEKFQGELREGDFYWSFAFKGEYYDPAAAEFLLNYHGELTRKRVDDRTIVHSGVLDQVKKTYSNVPDLQIKATDQKIPTGMSITKDTVAHLVWGENPVAIAVCSPPIVKRYQDFFLEAWEKSRIMA